MFSIAHNIPEIKDKLKRLKTLVGKSPNWQDDIIKELEKGVSTVKRLTPRSSGTRGSQRGGKHIRDGWTLRVIGKSGKDRVPVVSVIYNKLTHKANGQIKKGAMLKTVGGKTKSYSLLEILEYGSPPHVIRPVAVRFKKIAGARSGAFKAMGGRRFLRFETGGGVVFTKRVDHPGTKAYGMVRVTRAKTSKKLRKVIKKWSRKILKEWKKG